MKQMILGFHFAGVDPDEIATGCNPFQVTYVGIPDYYRAQEAASLNSGA